MIPPAVGALMLAVALGLVALTPATRAVIAAQVQPPPPTVYVDPDASCGLWWPLAVEVGWPERELPQLDRVMWCESRCEPRAYNRSTASGLMQVLARYFAAGADPFDPQTNLATALEVWRSQGWRAWSCY